MRKQAEHGATVTLRLRAFTLVELLVVIGIIALLLSILTPALNKARQQANLLVCQSNLKNIGNLVQTYVAENRGFFPYGRADREWNGYGPAARQSYGLWWSSKQVVWFWSDSLALEIRPIRGPTYGTQNQAMDYPNIFHDVDNVQIPYANTYENQGAVPNAPPYTGYQQCCDYTANIRVFPDTGTPDLAQGTTPNTPGYKILNGGTLATTPGTLPLRPAGSIQRSSEVMMIWCGAANLFQDTSSLNYFNFGADAVTWNLDNAAITDSKSHAFLFPQPASKGFKPASYNNLIALDDTYPGYPPTSSALGNVTLGYLKAENTDVPASTQFNLGCQMRFRHLNNRAANFLFVDGHVETRMIGDVRREGHLFEPNQPRGHSANFFCCWSMRLLFSGAFDGSGVEVQG